MKKEDQSIIKLKRHPIYHLVHLAPLLILIFFYNEGLLTTCEFGSCLFILPVAFCLSVILLAYILSFFIKRYLASLFLSFLILASIASTTVFVFLKNGIHDANVREQEEVTEKEGIANMIWVDESLIKQGVSSPVTVRGKAKKEWYVDGKFPVKITDIRTQVLGEGYVYAIFDQEQKNSTTYPNEEWILFEGTIQYEFGSKVYNEDLYSNLKGLYTTGYINFYGPNFSEQNKNKDIYQVYTSFYKD